VQELLKGAGAIEKVQEPLGAIVKVQGILKGTRICTDKTYRDNLIRPGALEMCSEQIIPYSEILD
jgi:hypothetical protein